MVNQSIKPLKKIKNATGVQCVPSHSNARAIGLVIGQPYILTSGKVYSLQSHSGFYLRFTLLLGISSLALSVNSAFTGVAAMR